MCGAVFRVLYFFLFRVYKGVFLLFFFLARKTKTKKKKKRICSA